MMLLALISTQTFTFGGGNAMELAWSLAEEKQRPVAILYDRYLPTFSSFSINPLDEPNLINRIGRKLELESAGKKLFAYAPAAWAEDVIRSGMSEEGHNPSFASISHWPEKANSDGTLTIKSLEKPLAINKMLEGPWPKPVKVSGFYNNFRIILAAKNQPPEEVLKTIAATIGAKAEFGKDVWKLSFDAKEYRKRLIERIKLRAASAPQSRNGPLQTADANLCISALDVLTDEQLAAAVEQPNDSIELPVASGTALYSAAMQRLEAYSRATFNNGTMLGSSMVKMLDLARPIQVVFKPQGGSVSIQGMEKGRPTGGITF